MGNEIAQWRLSVYVYNPFVLPLAKYIMHI